MNGETLGIGESIKVTVVKANADMSIAPIILVMSCLFFIFLCYKAWNERNNAPKAVATAMRFFDKEE